MQKLERTITNLIAVGWRKGVDSVTSSHIYCALNPLFFNADPVIVEIAQEQVEAQGTAVAQVIGRYTNIKDVDVNELALALKTSACIDRPCKRTTELLLTGDNQGFEILKSLMPIEFEVWGRPHKYTLRDDEIYEKAFYEKIDRGSGWDSFGFIGQDKWYVASIILVELVNRYPSIKEIFKEQLIDPEAKYRKALYEASLECTDEDWESLATWIIYCLEDEDILELANQVE